MRKLLVAVVAAGALVVVPTATAGAAPPHPSIAALCLALDANPTLESVPAIEALETALHCPPDFGAIS